MHRVKLCTGAKKKFRGPPINWKAEKHMRNCQRELDKDKSQYNTEQHWQRIPKQQA